MTGYLKKVGNKKIIKQSILAVAFIVLCSFIILFTTVKKNEYSSQEKSTWLSTHPFIQDQFPLDYVTHLKSYRLKCISNGYQQTNTIIADNLMLRAYMVCAYKNTNNRTETINIPLVIDIINQSEIKTQVLTEKGTNGIYPHRFSNQAIQHILSAELNLNENKNVYLSLGEPNILFEEININVHTSSLISEYYTTDKLNIFSKSGEKSLINISTSDKNLEIVIPTLMSIEQTP